MKQKLLYIFLFIFSVLLGTGDALAQTQYYVLEKSGPIDILGTNKDYTIEQGSVLTFNYENAYKSGFWGFKSEKKIYVTQYDGNGSEIKEDDFSNEGTNESGTITLDSKTRKIVFKGDNGGTKKVKNIKVTRASYLTPTSSTINWAPSLNDTKTETITFNYAHANSTGTVEVNYSGTAAVSISQEDTKTNKEGSAGTLTLTVNYTATQIGTMSGKITVTHKTNGKTDATATITINPFTVGKEIYSKHVYKLTDIHASLANATIKAGDEEKGFISNTGLLFIATNSSSPLTLTQSSNEYTIIVSNGNSTTYFEPEGTGRSFTIELYGDPVTVTIPGPCYMVEYEAELKSNNGTIFDTFNAAVSTDGVNWSNVRTEETVKSDYTKYEDRFNHTMRQLRFERAGTHLSTYSFRDIRFTMQSYMNTNVGDLAFPETMITKESPPQDVSIEWSDVENAASNLAVLLDDNASSAFSTVSFNHNPNKPWAESQGIDARWGTSTLKLKYAPKTEGEHEGFVYIHDNIRFTRIKVSGTAYSNHLQLQPTVNLSTQRTGLEYPYVTLNRTLNEGYSTLTLPFDTKVSELSGYAQGDYVAQLSLVTYNKADGYTLFFKKEAEGIITAHKPYVISRTTKVENPQWTDCHVYAPQTSTVSGTTDLKGWKMTGNYTPGFSMSGKYGIANGKLALGGASSTLNAYTAYFEPPTNAQNIRTRVAIMDDDGNATYIGEIRDGRLVPEAIYGADGIRQTELKNGINIVRTKDGRVRKIWKR